jgi:hypothetical protein
MATAEESTPGKASARAYPPREQSHRHFVDVLARALTSSVVLLAVALAASAVAMIRFRNNTTQEVYEDVAYISGS